MKNDDDMGADSGAGFSITLPNGQTITLDAETLERQMRNLSRKLETIGLSPYEARVYIALVAHGYGHAETIAQTAKVPRTSAYKILQALVEKGFAVATEGRPRIYKPEAPMRVYQKVTGEIRELFENLNMLHEVVREKGEPQIIYTIYGKNRVLEKIGELMDKCTGKFIISTPNFSEIHSPLAKKFQQMLDRDIDVTVITKPFQRVPQDANVVRKDRLMAVDIVSDSEKAILASGDLNACGYTDNANLAEHLERFLRILIEH